MAKQFYRMAVTAALMASLACMTVATEPDALAPVTGGRRIMGAPWKIKVFATDQTAGEAAIAAALLEVERLERILSDYDPESELSRLSAAAPMQEPVTVSHDLLVVLVAAESFRTTSAGAFDITIGPLTTLWRQARRSGRLPRDDKLAAARAAVGGDGIELDHQARRVRLTKPGMRLDAGGIGMGYAADRAMAVLKTHRITSAMIDASGDILVSAAPPGTIGWRILVAPLRPGGEGETISLVNAAVTTSGDAFQAVEIDGVRYSHIVDPRTGLGVRGPSAVTVIAPDATAADALATAANVLGPVHGPALLKQYPEVSARFMWREEKSVRTLVTDGWPDRDAAQAVTSQ
jgi:thiamine biosynthesis lipoprotein